MNQLCVVLLIGSITGACTFTTPPTSKPSSKALSKRSSTHQTGQKENSSFSEWPNFLNELQQAMRLVDSQKMESLVKYGILLDRESLAKDGGVFTLVPSPLKELILQASPNEVAIVSDKMKKDPKSLEERHFIYDERDQECKKNPDCMATMIHLYIAKYKEGFRIIGGIVAG